MKYILFLVFFSFFNSYSQNINFVYDGEQIELFTIYFYNLDNTIIIRDSIKASKFKKLLIRSDSSFIKYSFYSERLRLNYLNDNIYNLRQQLSLNTVFIDSKARNVKEIKVKSNGLKICSLNVSNQPQLVAMSSDSIKGKKIIAIEYYFKRKFRRFDGSKIYSKGSVFIPILTAIDSLSNIKIKNVLNSNIGKQTIVLKRNGWHRVDLDSLNLYVPKAPYFGIGLYPIKGNLITSCMKYNPDKSDFISLIYRKETERGYLKEEWWEQYKEEMEYPKSPPDYIFPFKLIIED